MKKYGFLLVWSLLIAICLFPSWARAALVSGPDWEVAAFADLNGDGAKDVLWKNCATGEVALWYMRKNTLVSEQKIETMPDSSSWSLAGVGDFNGDGHLCILLSNETNGDLRFCYLSGSIVTARDTIEGLGSPWKVAGVGDFDGDGHDDLVWRNPITGETVVWYMKGTIVLNRASLEGLPPPWDIICINDFDNDGSPDILWKNSVTGNIVVWYMRGLVPLVALILDRPTTPSTAAQRFSIRAVPFHHIDFGHIATLSATRPLFPGDAPCRPLFFSASIRAPPMPRLYYRQKENRHGNF